MAATDFDIIVVGAGIAGCCCAAECARAGLNVLLLERASQPGGKNLSGGRLYTAAFDALFPDFSHAAPLERAITHEKISALTTDSATTLNFQHTSASSYSVLRARLDPWLFRQAEQAGAQCLTATQVDSLHVENGIVRGVVIEGETLSARAVVIAEGANTLLAEQHKLLNKLPEQSVAVGVKEVLALPREELENRFALEGNEGAAWLFTGGICGAQPAGGFLYTNNDSLSVGIVCPLASLRASPEALPDLLESFKQHPTLRPLLRRAELVEYAAHLIPECGLNGLPERLAGPGYLLVGDSARFCINTGFTVRGMDLAALSARAAAQTLIASLEQDGSTDLARAYRRQLERSTLWAVLERYRRMPDFLQTPGLFQDYPHLLAELQRDIFDPRSLPPPRLSSLLWKHASRAGISRLIKDIFRGGRSL
ncbi:Electron transfer flavoprotein-ubiquinone oxidoreductase [Cedecea lapagei]|uniref:Protein FixC n=1 Tax=Cedecea lapagei TaxID=158823 RepID=A0A3S4IKT5_9ENTR|nr:FAD-dependent oxidoreductase [Cedecea lapagei]VEB95618.1 Electron transfer flavoprotein-ubiquinone oxidoreductase [Cedecea lapagei]